MLSAHLTIRNDEPISPISDTLFGNFVEHLGRAVYGGVYQPESRFANNEGFRKDVIDLTKEMGVSLIRYPGGNFVSGFDWKNSVGAKRVPVLDLAWEALEPNTVGLAEFYSFSQSVDSLLLLAVNLGTDTPASAQYLVEYCNAKTGEWAEKRKADGHPEPYAIHHWCLGNEMDGNWQIGSKTPEEYGAIARETAKLMKGVDPTIECVVCGSSSFKSPTFPEWDRKVLERCYPQADYLSLHAYFTYETPEHDLADFLASPTVLDTYIRSAIVTCDYVKAFLHSGKTMMLALDEWNVWHPFLDNPITEKWQCGLPRLEEYYDMADALVAAGLLSVILNHSDRIKIACLAQLVNVIAPILTDPKNPNAEALRQTTFYPLALTARAFRGKTALKTTGTVPEISTKTIGKTPLLFSSVAYSEKERCYAFLAVNAASEKMKLSLSFDRKTVFSQGETMHTGDIHQKNSFKNPKAVVPSKIPGKKVISKSQQLLLEPYSLQIILFAEAR